MVPPMRAVCPFGAASGLTWPLPAIGNAWARMDQQGKRERRIEMMPKAERKEAI